MTFFPEMWPFAGKCMGRDGGFYLPLIPELLTSYFLTEFRGLRSLSAADAWTRGQYRECLGSKGPRHRFYQVTLANPVLLGRA